MEALWDAQSEKFNAPEGEDARGRHELERLPKLPEGNLVSLEAFTLTSTSASSTTSTSTPAAGVVAASADVDKKAASAEEEAGAGAEAEAEVERVLIGVCGASELEQFAVRADGRVRRLPALDLEFKQFCFAIDRPPAAGRRRAGSLRKSWLTRALLMQ